MEPATMIVDSSASKLAIRTRATGMLARLAHDLELEVSDVRGEVRRSDDSFTGQLIVPVDRIRVVGRLHGDRVDRGGISASDCGEIERKIRAEVFPGVKEIQVRGGGREWKQIDVTIDSGLGKTSVPMSIRGTEADRQIRITGRTELSLAKLGVREIKGPLGAFRVKDAVEVLFEIILRPEG